MKKTLARKLLRSKKNNNNTEQGFTLVELLFTVVFISLISAISLGGLTGCSPDVPYFPRTYFTSLEDVVIRPVNLNSVNLDEQFHINKKPLFDENSKIAVFSFKTPEGTQGGALVSDMFTALLEEKGYKVVERDNIERILREQEIIGEGKTSLTDLDIAERLGKLVAADYMVFGAVTLYQAEPQTVYLPTLVRDEDREGYEKDYNIYRDWYVNRFWPFWETQEQRIKQLRSQLGVLALEELEDKLSEVSKKEFRVIASVGISAKVVDVKNATIRWLGQGETNDFAIVSATKRILEEFLKSMQGETLTVNSQSSAESSSTLEAELKEINSQKESNYTVITQEEV